MSLALIAFMSDCSSLPISLHIGKRRIKRVKCKMPGTFKAYMDSILVKTGKSPEDFYRLAVKKGFIKRGKIVAEHADMLRWLKSEIKLGHVHANFVILYLRLRTNDPRGGENIKKWARETGYKALGGSRRDKANAVTPEGLR